MLESVFLIKIVSILISILIYLGPIYYFIKRNKLTTNFTFTLLFKAINKSLIIVLPIILVLFLYQWLEYLLIDQQKQKSFIELIIRTTDLVFAAFVYFYLPIIIINNSLLVLKYLYGKFKFKK